MLARGLIRRAVAAAVAAGAGFVAVVALGLSIFYALSLVIQPLAAAVITALLFSVVAALVALLFVRTAEGDAQDESYEPEGLALRAVHLFKQRPILGTVAALVGGWIFLRNPALATMVAAAFADKQPRRR